MKQKILTLIFGMIFLIGVVAAANSLDNLEGITIPVSPVIAGNTFSANFSFDYLANGINEDNLPLIIKLNLTSGDQTNYPVWRGDFEIEGFLDKCIWNILGVCVFSKTVPFSCSEEETQTIINPIDTTTINNVSNGTFYCYDAEGDLKLNEHDEVFLNITSHPALYPSQYTLMAEMFYLNDTTSPNVLISNKDDFENKYYAPLTNIELFVDISDGRGIDSVLGKIITPTQNISLEKQDNVGTIYTFTKTLPIDIQEGNYELKITAQDTSGNKGNDSTTLKIDKTGPTITLVSPGDDVVVSEIIPLKMNVSDMKSGPNQDEVYYRLREIVNGQICPEIGTPLGGNYSCTRTDWINLPYNLTTEFYEEDVNTTSLNLTSGEYWLDVKAKDILGNEGFL